MSPRLTAQQRTAVARGWSASDVDATELVDDAWIAANTTVGKAPSVARAVGGRVLSSVRTFGVDPIADLEDDAAAELAGITRKLPRMARRYTLQKGGLTRDQMRRIAARTGYPYVEAWSGRNQGAMKGVYGALIHHTGTSASAAGDYPTLRIVRDGRSDLQNSLCAFGLGRSGTAYLISEKLSWHAGAGNINGLTDGNGYLAGIEAESDGKSWTAEQRDAYPRLVASILIEIGQTDPRPNHGDKYTTRHGTYALPKGRKHDASGLDMDLFWRQVYAYLANPASLHKNSAGGPVPAPAPAGGGTHTVVRGDTLWALAKRYGVSVAQLSNWNALGTTTLSIGQVLRVTAGGAAPAPAPAPAPVAPVMPHPPALPGWSLPRGHYYGLRSGPAASRGGVSAAERAVIKVIQQRLIWKGYVPGVTDWRHGWADGIFGQATKDAVTRFQRKEMPRTTRFGEVWSDDFRQLAR